MEVAIVRTQSNNTPSGFRQMGSDTMEWLKSLAQRRHMDRLGFDEERASIPSKQSTASGYSLNNSTQDETDFKPFENMDADFSWVSDDDELTATERSKSSLRPVLPKANSYHPGDIVRQAGKAYGRRTTCKRGIFHVPETSVLVDRTDDALICGCREPHLPNRRMTFPLNDGRSMPFAVSLNISTSHNIHRLLDAQQRSTYGGHGHVESNGAESPSSSYVSRAPRRVTEGSMHIPPERQQHELTQDDVELRETLGRGGCATTYKATLLRDINTGGHSLSRGSMVCVKVLNDEVTLNTVNAEIEALQLSQCLGKHPNIVQSLGFNMTAQPYFIVMELVDGWSLADELRLRGAVKMPDICTWTLQIAEGLQHLHAVYLLHCDLKSSNIMLQQKLLPADREPATYSYPRRRRTSRRSYHLDSAKNINKMGFKVQRKSESGRIYGWQSPLQARAIIGCPPGHQMVAKIVDFGETANLLVKARDGGGMSRERGTLRWMPPEVMDLQVSNDARTSYGTAADVYCLGMVIYEMLSGKVPYVDMGTMQIIMAVTGGVRPSFVNVQCSALLEFVVRMCLNTNTEHRPTVRQISAFVCIERDCDVCLALNESDKDNNLFEAFFPCVPADLPLAVDYLAQFTVGYYQNLRQEQEPK